MCLPFGLVFFFVLLFFSFSFFFLSKYVHSTVPFFSAFVDNAAIFLLCSVVYWYVCGYLKDNHKQNFNKACIYSFHMWKSMFAWVKSTQ